MVEREIITLDGLKHIRARYSMYLAAEPEEALKLAVREAWVNAADELTIHPRKNAKIVITFGSNTYAVQDNGQGIPEDKLKDAYLKANTGSNFKNRTANLIGANGLGVKALSATAKSLVVQSRTKKITIVAGPEEPILEKTEKIDKIEGTWLIFEPLPEIYGDATINFDNFCAEIDEAAKFYPNITFVVQKDSNKKTFYYPKGLKLPNTDAYYESENLIISLSCSQGEIKPFANRLYLPATSNFMSHFKSRFTKLINDVTGLKLSGTQIQAALSGYVAIYVDDPIFSNQSKTSVANKEVNPEISQAVNEVVSQLEKSSKWQAVLKTLETEQKAEEAAERAKAKFLATKEKIKTKKVDLNKYTTCHSKNRDECELYLTEGDSAATGVVQTRNPATQAVIALRGKILNASRCSFEQLLNNNEIQLIVKALGLEITETGFKIPKKLNFGKVILLCDADDDGYHITSLILTFFYYYAKPLIEQGLIYRAEPYLYRIEYGKDQYKFIRDDRALTDFIRTNKIIKHKISRYKGIGESNPQELQEMLFSADSGLRQYTIKDAAKAAKYFALMENDPEGRRNFYTELEEEDFEDKAN